MRRKDPIRKIELQDGRIRWRFVVDVGRKPNGKRDQRTFTCDTLREAREKRAEVVSGVARGTYVRATRKTLGEHLNEWLAGRRGIKRSTINSYRDSLKPVRDRYDHVPVQELTKSHVDQLVNDMLASGRRVGKKGLPLAPTTVIRTLSLLGAALDDAMKQGLVVRNVARLVDRPRVRQREMGTWTAEEAAAFLRFVEDHRLSAAWQMSLYGLRRGEVLGLRWCDIDLSGKTMTVAIERVVSDGTVYEDEPKSERGKRTLPLDDDLVAALRALRKRRAAEQLKAGAAYTAACSDCGESHLVVDELGDPIHPEGYSDRFETLVKRAKLSPIRLHDARHTCGTVMHLRGVKTAVISAWLGHASASFTMKTYVHSQAEALVDAGKVLRTALGG